MEQENTIRSKDETLETILLTPHIHDVLCGSGNGALRHVGNVHYRRIVNINKRFYLSLPKRSKFVVAKSIVESIRLQSPPGRFLKKTACGSFWNEVGEVEALRKTTQALREGAPLIRKEINEERKASKSSKHVTPPFWKCSKNKSSFSPTSSTIEKPVGAANTRKKTSNARAVVCTSRFSSANDNDESKECNQIAQNHAPSSSPSRRFGHQHIDRQTPVIFQKQHNKTLPPNFWKSTSVESIQNGLLAKQDLEVTNNGNIYERKKKSFQNNLFHDQRYDVAMISNHQPFKALPLSSQRNTLVPNLTNWNSNMIPLIPTNQIRNDDINLSQALMFARQHYASASSLLEASSKGGNQEYVTNRMAPLCSPRLSSSQLLPPVMISKGDRDKLFCQVPSMFGVKNVVDHLSDTSSNGSYKINHSMSRRSNFYRDAINGKEQH